MGEPYAGVKKFPLQSYSHSIRANAGKSNFYLPLNTPPDGFTKKPEGQACVQKLPKKISQN
jgi:hypothetical protein